MSRPPGRSRRPPGRSPLERIYGEVDARASREDHAEGAARAALVTGVSIGGALLVAGLILTLVRAEPRPNVPPGFSETFRGALRGNGVALLYLGLLAIAATPVVRVLVMAAVYLRRAETFMLIVSLIVLALLGLSLLLGTG